MSRLRGGTFVPGRIVISADARPLPLLYCPRASPGACERKEAEMKKIRPLKDDGLELPEYALAAALLDVALVLALQQLNGSVSSAIGQVGEAINEAAGGDGRGCGDGEGGGREGGCGRR